MSPIFNTNIKLILKINILKLNWTQQPELWNKMMHWYKTSSLPVTADQQGTALWSAARCQVIYQSHLQPEEKRVRAALSRTLTSDLLLPHTCQSKRCFCSITVSLTVMVSLITDWFKDLFDWFAALRSAVSNRRASTKVKPEVRNYFF